MKSFAMKCIIERLNNTDQLKRGRLIENLKHYVRKYERGCECKKYVNTNE